MHETTMAYFLHYNYMYLFVCNVWQGYEKSVISLCMWFSIHVVMHLVTSGSCNLFNIHLLGAIYYLHKIKSSFCRDGC